MGSSRSVIAKQKKRGALRTPLSHSPLVASSGIEPESGASETLILSIVLRGQNAKVVQFKK